ncbi:MAG: CvpA family protein [Bacteroidota bacterium]
MNTFDTVLLVILGIFMFAGWRSGFLKKLIALACLALALIIATKYASSFGEEVLVPAGISAGTSTTLSYILIVAGIMLAQAIVYKIAIKKLAEGVWNRVGGLIIGLVEGGILLSLMVIFLSIYFHFPSNETRSDSMLYRPVKNFAPRIFDSINTFFPESEDFYQEIITSVKKSSNHKEAPLHQ